MREIAAYEARARVRGAAVLTVALSLLALLYIWMFPSISGTVDLDQYLEAFPPALVEAFGLRALGTIEGFLAAELYAFGWVILLGLYFAHLAASMIAADVERGRIDLLLALPMRRWRLLLGVFGSAFVPLLVINGVVPVAVYGGVLLIDESINAADLLAVHALSVPYLLSCAGVGLVASVVFDRSSLAQRAAVGLVFGLFLIESVVAGTDYEWLGTVSPSRYYDPSAILVDGTYDLAGAAILTSAAILLVAGALLWFSRKDVN